MCRYPESTRHISSLRKFGWNMGCQIITVLTGQSATKCFSQCFNNSCCESKPNCYSNPKTITLWGFPEGEQDLWKSCKYESFWCQYFFWFKLSDTTTANKFIRLQDTQLLGNSSSVRIIKITKTRRLSNGLFRPLTTHFFELFFLCTLVCCVTGFYR